MRRTAATLLLAAGVACAPLAVPSAVAVPPPDLPSGVPPAALEDPPTLATPDGWPLAEPFPRTSGTGRLGGGVFAWSDFLYDDHGAGAPLPAPLEPETASLAPTAGTYTYPAGPASGNGADVFRTAVGVDDAATYWRVDWQTLADPDVPIAAFGVDTTPGSGAALPFPAGAGVRAAGLEQALVVSSRGASLVDAVTGAARDVEDLGGAVTVDEEAQSFVVRLPRSALQPSGTWRLWLVAGLADDAGTGFAPPPQELVPGQARVYNAAFRDYADEPPRYNFWFENGQAPALLAGDVTPFSADVDWGALASGASTPEPRPTGYSNRWYVSSLDLGDGVVQNEGPPGPGDLRPNFLGRVQPYAVYVPTGYDPSDPAPLSWVLHSLGVQHNQYGALDPRQLQQTCEARGSICATTLARGPDTWYFDEAELDFWEVWRALADAYALDAERTVLTGYSMGGYGTYKLGAAYPDLFAQGLALAAPPTCGIRVGGPVAAPGGPGRCTTDDDTTPLLPSFRHVPVTIGHGAVDELVPVTSVVEHVAAADVAGLRYRFHLYPAAGHLAWAVSDGFDNETATLRLDRRAVDPSRIDYPFYPSLVREDLGFGPDGAYWLTGLVGRDDAPGTLARASAVSAARPEPEITLVDEQGPLPPPPTGYPGPGTFQEQSWQLGDAPEPEPRVDLTLENVSAATVDVVSAGLAPDGPGRVPVVTDGATTVTLAGLAPGTAVLRDGTRVATAGEDGAASAELADDAVLSWGAAASPAPSPSAGPTGGGGGTGGTDTGGTPTAAGAPARMLAATGLLDVLPMLGAALTAGALVMVRVRRRSQRPSDG